MEFPFTLKWQQIKEHPELHALMPDSTKFVLSMKSGVAMFDLDGTLITTSSGRVHAKDRFDWKFFSNKKVVQKLKKLHKEGKFICIITNQSNLGKIPTIKEKILDIIQELDIPVVAFILAGYNSFRKPSKRVWEYVLNTCSNPSTDPSYEDILSSSFYVGDAAGRTAGWRAGRKKDFSCSDRCFALNIGIKFYTPEQYFLDMEPTEAFKLPEFNPKKFCDEYEGKEFWNEEKEGPMVSGFQEIVMMVAAPASGKSAISRQFKKKGYVIVSNDALKRVSLCKKTCIEGLTQGKSVVIDNTNGSPKARKVYIDIARKYGVPVRCIWLDFSRELCKHLNVFRSFFEQKYIPRVAFASFYKRFEEPTLREFDQIHHIETFVPIFEGVSKQKKKEIFRCYLVG